MWVLHKINAGGINMVVRSCHLRKLFCNTIKGALPQITSKREHVCFVHQREMLASSCCSQLKCVAHATLYAVCSIDAALRCNFLWRTFAQHTAFTNIWPFGVFANHNEVVRRSVPRCRARKWSTIDVQVQLKTHLEQQPTLNHTRRHTRRANSAKQDRIKVAQLRQRRVRQHFTIAQISRATQIKISCL